MTFSKIRILLKVRKVISDMRQDEQKLLLNQVRHRILQCVLRHGRITAREIQAELKDIPQASLYRQIKTLFDSGLLKVCEERQVRGTLEHRYELAPELIITDDTEQTELNIQFTLLSLAQDFSDYYADPANNPVKDMVSLITTPLMVSDEEFEQLIRGINELTRQYMNKSPSGERRTRKLTFVASPM